MNCHYSNIKYLSFSSSSCGWPSHRSHAALLPNNNKHLRHSMASTTHEARFCLPHESLVIRNPMSSNTFHLTPGSRERAKNTQPSTECTSYTWENWERILPPKSKRQQTSSLLTLTGCVVRVTSTSRQSQGHHHYLTDTGTSPKHFKVSLNKVV